MMRMSILAVIIISLVMSTSFVFSKKHYTGNEEVILEGGFEGRNAFISYVTINNCRYIVKQKKIMKKRMAVVREALAAYIAKDLKIAHSVEIISPKDNIPGKIYPNLPATLHTIAPGKIVREYTDTHYCELSLQQRSLDDDSLEGRWLTEEIINQMTWHKQLPIIVALDLFISNTDRHRSNLFYDPVTDSFCAIDMDCIFRCDMPEFAYKKLDLMVNVYEKQFTAQEIDALIIVKETLEFLLKKHSPKEIIAKLHKFVRQAECMDKVREIVECEAIIIKSQESVRELVLFLDTIITNFMLKISCET